MRIARETGGIYYLLHSPKTTAYDYKKLLDGYAPELASRAEIAKRNSRNALRRAIMETIIGWKQIREGSTGATFSSYFQDSAAGRTRMKETMVVVDAWLKLLDAGIAKLKALGDVAVNDAPKRWQANRELMWAELHKLRFQLTQYKHALDDLMNRKNVPPPGDIGWHISWYRNPILRGDFEEVTTQKRAVERMFQTVIDTHAGTPWEVFAKHEMKTMRGFAIHPWSRSRSKPAAQQTR